MSLTKFFTLATAALVLYSCTQPKPETSTFKSSYYQVNLLIKQDSASELVLAGSLDSVGPIEIINSTVKLGNLYVQTYGEYEVDSVGLAHKWIWPCTDPMGRTGTFEIADVDSATTAYRVKFSDRAIEVLSKNRKQDEY